MSDALHILRLDVENILKIKAVQADVAGADVVPVVGANGAGKSSLLTAIEMAVGGKRAFPDQPLREGATKGHILIDTGEYIIDRRVTAGGSSLTLKLKDGTPVREPQAVLDRLVGDSADPMAFLSLKPAAQRETLMRLAGLDFTKADELLAQTVARRTEHGRDVRTLEAREQAARKVWPADLPDDEVSVVQIAKELQGAKNLVATREQAARNVNIYTDRVRSLEAQLADARAMLAESEEVLRTSKGVSGEELAELERRFTTAEATNRMVRERAEHRRIETLLADARAEHAEAENTIEQIKARKEAKLREAKLPVQGLSVSDDGVMFNGVPLSQASQAEKIRVGVAVALAQNPRFRVVIVRDGSLLDDNSRAMLKQACKEAGAQLVLELVRPEEPNGIFLVDGTQVAAPE